jgi:hypothetical protein
VSFDDFIACVHRESWNEGFDSLGVPLDEILRFAFSHRGGALFLSL